MPTITTLTSTSGSYRLLPNTSDLVLAFDIETNGLLYSKEAPVSAIWCIVIFDCKEKRYYEYRPHEIEDAYAHLSKATILIGHNIISYDIPVLQVLKPGWTTKAQFIDTFTLASLVYPKDKLLELDTSIFDHIDKKLRGRQSLRAWGQRLQNLKGDHEDWTQFSEEMLSYCKNDVLVTIQLYTYLVNSLKSQDPELKNLKSIAIEHDLSQILMLQMHTGWTFDVDSALDLDEKLRTRLNQLTEELDRTIPATVERTVIVPKRDNKTKGYIKGIPFTKEKTVPFNPGSRQQILQFFKEKYDWQPKEKTEKGNFKVNDDILEELSYPEAKLLAEYFLLQKRLGQLSDGNKSWLGLVDHNNVIHGSIVSSGCVTGRSIHRDPNLGQVPNAGAPYGPECRSLFRPTPGFMLMGSDAKALELRCLGGYLAHYDNGDYASKVIDPDVDIHTYNQEKFGVDTRDISKRLIYCVLYGGGPTKTGSIIAPTESTEYQKQIGIKTLDNFYKEIPALKHLKDDVETAINSRGYLRGLDGRELYVRSAYKGLNLLLQSAGAIIMKRVGIEIYEGLTNAGFIYGVDWTQNAYVHDEYQNSVLPHLVDTAKDIIINAYPKAGKFLDFKCPIEGDVKVGTNWYETH